MRTRAPNNSICTSHSIINNSNTLALKTMTRYKILVGSSRSITTNPCCLEIPWPSSPVSRISEAVSI